MRLHSSTSAIPASGTSSFVRHVHRAPRIVTRQCPSPSSPLQRGCDVTAWRCSRSHTGVVARAGAMHASTDSITKALEALEAERDEASKTAESCAKTCVRLAEMVKLLDDLALEKVKAEDQAGAKAVLEEKKSIREVLEKTSGRAQSNYALAAKLAQKIGEKQNELLLALKSTAGASSPWDGSAGRSAGSGGRTGGSSSSSSSSTGYSSSGTGYSGGSSAGGASQYDGSGYSPRPTARPQWQSSLEESLARVKEQQSEAQIAGRYARQSAEDSVAAAKARLAAQRAGEDIATAASRVRRNPEESLAQAQQRLRQRDAELLAYCQRIVARFRRGEWVDDDELEFAFRMLEKRMA